MTSPLSYVFIVLLRDITCCVPTLWKIFSMDKDFSVNRTNFNFLTFIYNTSYFFHANNVFSFIYDEKKKGFE